MKIEKTKETPFIYLSVKECKFEIKGSSYSENIEDIYKEVLKWMDKEIPKLNCELNCEFQIYVINSISKKNLMLVFNKLSDFYKKGKKMKIKWFADRDDEDIYELAEEIIKLFGIPINIILR